MSDAPRPDPDALLVAIQREEAQKRRGKLKVFFGMAAGVGKTYAMLQAAQAEKAAGRDVIIGYVEGHGRKETDRLTVGLPLVPRRRVEHRGLPLEELDLDAVLARRPQLALVDELAHTNAPGSRHPKRYQDVLELLDAGIDVYSTLNVQHVESRADTVREITGSTVQETVPDRVLDAAQIELVDLPPNELLRRLDEGKVYLPERAAVAMVNFFREGNLTALREMALRLAAEKVGQQVRDYLQVMQIERPWKSGHRLLVAVSPSPWAGAMVRWTRRLADSLDSPWLAVYVETARPLTEGDQTRLTQHLSLARELGAEVITTTDENVVRGLLRLARQHHVTQIVVGKPAGGWFHRWFRAGAFFRRLMRESGDVDLHVVRAEKLGDAGARRAAWRPWLDSGWRQYALALGAVSAVTLASGLLNPWVGYRTVALNLLLAVVVLALFVGRGPIFLAATLSALLWNFFFLPPVFTFYIKSLEDAMMFGMYFIIALVLGQLVARIRAQERAERRREERTTALYLLTRELADAVGVEDIARNVVRHVGQVFGAQVGLLLADGGGNLPLQAEPASTLTLSEKERSVAAWVFANGQAAGPSTDNLPMAECLHLPLATSGGPVGVLSLHFQRSTRMTLDQRNLLESFARQTALVVDRQRLSEATQRTQLVAESERLSKALLNSISHELRTPIAAITSAVSGLSAPPAERSLNLHQALVEEITQAAQRLNRVVGNLLDMTRLESGHVTPRLEWCEVSDLVNVSLQHVNRELASHPVTTDVAPGLPLVQMDFRLMEQVLVNLLLNAAVHTPPGTPVRVGARRERDLLVLALADRGPGLPAEALSQIFDKFYRAPGAPAGGTGLGLSIVKGFVEAQGGRVEAGNLPEGGAVFRVVLPIGEAPPVPAEAEP